MTTYFITMTTEQTEIYDGDDDRAVAELMAELRAEAKALCGVSGDCEIYTSDGELVDFVEHD